MPLESITVLAERPGLILGMDRWIPSLVNVCKIQLEKQRNANYASDCLLCDPLASSTLAAAAADPVRKGKDSLASLLSMSGLLVCLFLLIHRPVKGILILNSDSRAAY